MTPSVVRLILVACSIAKPQASAILLIVEMEHAIRTAMKIIRIVHSTAKYQIPVAVFIVEMVFVILIVGKIHIVVS